VVCRLEQNCIFINSSCTLILSPAEKIICSQELCLSVQMLECWTHDHRLLFDLGRVNSSSDKQDRAAGVMYLTASLSAPNFQMTKFPPIFFFANTLRITNSTSI